MSECVCVCVRPAVPRLLTSWLTKHTMLAHSLAWVGRGCRGGLTNFNSHFQQFPAPVMFVHVCIPRFGFGNRLLKSFNTILLSDLLTLRMLAASLLPPEPLLCFPLTMHCLLMRCCCYCCRFCSIRCLRVFLLYRCVFTWNSQIERVCGECSWRNNCKIASTYIAVVSWKGKLWTYRLLHTHFFGCDGISCLKEWE